MTGLISVDDCKNNNEVTALVIGELLQENQEFLDLAKKLDIPLFFSSLDWPRDTGFMDKKRFFVPITNKGGRFLQDASYLMPLHSRSIPEELVSGESVLNKRVDVFLSEIRNNPIPIEIFQSNCHVEGGNMVKVGKDKVIIGVEAAVYTALYLLENPIENLGKKVFHKLQQIESHPKFEEANKLAFSCLNKLFFEDINTALYELASKEGIVVSGSLAPIFERMKNLVGRFLPSFLYSQNYFGFLDQKTYCISAIWTALLEVSKEFTQLEIKGSSDIEEVIWLPDDLGTRSGQLEYHIDLYITVIGNRVLIDDPSEVAKVCKEEISRKVTVQNLDLEKIKTYRRQVKEVMKSNLKSEIPLEEIPEDIAFLCRVQIFSKRVFKNHQEEYQKIENTLKQYNLEVIRVPGN